MLRRDGGGDRSTILESQGATTVSTEDRSDDRDASFDSVSCRDCLRSSDCVNVTNAGDGPAEKKKLRSKGTTEKHRRNGRKRKEKRKGVKTYINC